MSDINIQMQDSTGNNVYPQTKAKVVKIGTTDAETMLNELEARTETFIKTTEPTKDGLWIDTTDNEGSADSQLATQMKAYLDSKVNPLNAEVQTARGGETDLDTRLDKIDNLEVYGSEITTSNEVNNITVDTQKQLKVNMQGKTMYNYFGNDGDCEDGYRFGLYNATLLFDPNNKVFGNTGIKVTSTSATSSNVYLDYSNINKLDRTKYYAFSCYVKNGNFTNGLNVAVQITGSGLSWKSSGLITDTTKFTRVCIKLKPSDLTGATAILFTPINVGANTVGQYGWMDGLMLEEITSTQYNDSNFVPSPYVNGDTSVGDTLIRIKTKGKNLYNAIQGTTNNNSIVGFARGSTRISHKETLISVEPNTTYTISLSSPLLYVLYEYDKNYYGTTNPWSSSTITNLTFTTGANTYYIGLGFKINDTTTIYAEDYQIQLENGSVATDYEPYQESYVVLDQPLRSLPDGTKDEIKDGKLIKRVEKVTLDNTLFWQYSGTGTGYKVVSATNVVDFNCKTQPYALLKYGATKLCSNYVSPGGSIASEGAYVGSSGNGWVYLSLLSTDTGWGDSYTPTQAEIQAYFMGYVMRPQGQTGVLYNGTGTKEWVSYQTQKNGSWIVTSTLPTVTYDSYIPYKLYYKLPTLVISELPTQLVTYPNGSLILESDSRTWVRPQFSYKLLDNLKVNINDLEKGLSNTKRSVSSLPIVSNPNLLINGDFQVWQRGTSFTYGGTNTYSADRWVGASISAVTVSKLDYGGVRISNSTDFTLNSRFHQNIEVPRYLQGKTVTLTVRARSSIAGKVIGLGGMVYSNGFQPAGKQVSLSTSYDNYSLTLTLPYGADIFEIGIGLATSTAGVSSNVYWGLTAPTNFGVGYVDVEWMKLELGEKFTPFVSRSYTEELMMCKRYYQMLSRSTYYGTFGVGMVALTTMATILIPLPVPLRTTPTVLISSTATTENLSITVGGVKHIITSMYTDGNLITNNGISFNISTSDTLTVGSAATLAGGSTLTTFALDAEIY